MPKITRDNQEETVELLKKLLVIQLFSLGVPQERIAKVVGKQKLWVNALLKTIPKGESPNARTKKKSKK